MNPTTTGVDKFSPTGQLIWSLVSPYSGPGDFRGAEQCAVDDSGNIFIPSSDNKGVVVYGVLSTPVPVTTWGKLRTIYR